MRKLASIQKILNLSSIPNADSIEVASVLGWKVVVKKSEFQVGDLVVYCEIDSILPDKPEFEFLRKSDFRIKTVKLRGQVSQGICFPLDVLPEDFSDRNEGVDCTEVLGVTKYEPPIPVQLAGNLKGSFPCFIPKTDESRVQVLQKRLARYKGTRCYVTEKLDGSSVTYYVRNGEFGVCSRNWELKEDDKNAFWRFARENDLENKLLNLNKNIAIQGELIGEGIQKNKYKLKGQNVHIFNVWDIDSGKYYDYEKFKSLVGALGLKTVPILQESFSLIDDIEKLIDMAVCKSKLCDKVWAEGVVIRPVVEQNDCGERVSFKVINPKFLLKYED